MPTILILLRRFAHQLRKDHLDVVLLVLVVISITGMMGISFFEPQLSMVDAVWWTLVTITTVGYGDIYPTSLGGRIVGIFLMLFGIGFPRHADGHPGQHLCRKPAAGGKRDETNLKHRTFYPVRLEL